MSSVTCNAAITTLDDLDDGEGGDIEEIARESDPNLQPPTTPSPTKIGDNLPTKLETSTTIVHTSRVKKERRSGGTRSEASRLKTSHFLSLLPLTGLTGSDVEEQSQQPIVTSMVAERDTGESADVPPPSLGALAAELSSLQTQLELSKVELMGHIITDLSHQLQESEQRINQLVCKNDSLNRDNTTLKSAYEDQMTGLKENIKELERSGQKQNGQRGKNISQKKDCSLGHIKELERSGQKQNGQKDKNVSQKKDCSLCGSGKHPPFKCGKIQEIQAKKMDKPENLCERCCHWFKQGDPHQGACHIKSYLDKNGITKKMNLLCSIHQSTHYALCGACAPGQTTSGPKTSTPVVPGFMVSCLQQTNSLASDPTKIPQVAFMREVLTIKGKDGNTARVIAHYDSLSGANFSSEIPENFNWGEKGATSETFSLSTMIGREEYSLPVISLRIQGRGKRCLEADFLVNNYPEIEDTFSMPDLLKECGVSSMSQEERQIPLRIMFGVPCSTLFPQPQPIPKKMQREFPFLSLHQSLITGAQLISGRVSPATPAKAIHSFMGMTTPGVSGEPSVHQTSVHQTDSKEEEKRESLPSQD